MTGCAEVLKQRPVVRSDVDDQLGPAQPEQGGRFPLELREILAENSRRSARIRVFGWKQNRRIDDQTEWHELAPRAMKQFGRIGWLLAPAHAHRLDYDAKQRREAFGAIRFTMFHESSRLRWLGELVPPSAFGATSLVCLVALHRPRVSFVFFAMAGCWVCAMLARRRPGAARIMTRLLLFPAPDRPTPSDRLVFVQGTGLVILLGVLATPSWRNPPPLKPIYDDLAWTSLNLAVTRAKCGAASAIPHDVNVAAQLSTRADAVRTPVMEFATFTCSSIQPFVMGQNSLMLIEATTLRLNPRASLTTLARVLIAIQILGIGVFMTALTVAGVPGAWCALLLVAVMTFRDAFMVQHAYGVYPLLVPSVLGVIGIMTLVPRSCSPVVQIAFGAVLGAGIGAIGNLRTDLFLNCGVPAAVWLVSRSRSRGLFAAQGVAIIAGGVAFSLLCIRPIAQTQPQRLTGHPIMHPLVLGLAIPDNAVARQLGIKWDDSVGFDLAHAIQPGVLVLTSDYETVLRRFYVQLWRQRPVEMLKLYRVKFSAAARSFVPDTTGSGFNGQLWRIVLRPLEASGASGWAVPALFAIGACAGLMRIRRWHDSWVMPLTLVVIAGGLNWLEAAIIIPILVPAYFGVAFLTIVAACLGLYQLVWHVAWWPMNRTFLPQSSER
jgi:hypothetical protein